MGIEIERKFLVADDAWRALVQRSEKLRQGYLATSSGVTVRVRTIDEHRGFITIKAGGSALARAEFEYEVPVADARQLLGYCRGAQIEKVRHTLDIGSGEWVVDEFRGRHDGLILAEIELESPTAGFDRPPWLGDEVTGDPQYYNSSLAALPSGGEI
jgi:CYTH domain-containing protein